jgi:hypothetical protein
MVLPRVWFGFDHIGPIDSAMPPKTHIEAPRYLLEQEASGSEGIVANSHLTRESPSLPAGRSESFPVKGVPCLRATSC